jgi:Family of unknown function (DUF6345)
MKTKIDQIKNWNSSALSLVRRSVCWLFPLIIAPSVLMGQSGPSLPVYQVLQSGIIPAQASALANSLGIPADSFLFTNKEVLFIDPSNFSAAPAMPVNDPAVISNLLAQTPNKVPGIPIKFEQLDFGALSSLAVLSSNAAVSSFANAMASVGLTPQSAAPIVTHTLLIANYTNDFGTILSTSNYLDTKVSYQFSLGGYPLIGPGAQVQVAYGPNGAVTRLLYAARQLAAGPMVNVISPMEASNRAAALFPGFNGQINVQLVYYAPPLSLGTVTSIIPYYLCGGSASITNPWPYDPVSTINLVQQLIPATDDPAFIPSPSLVANVIGNTQIVASASVSGGMPPYTYSWSGSDPNISGNASSQITNTPVMQVAPPQLAARLSSPDSMVISWVDPSGLFQLESASNLQTGSWSLMAGGVTSSNGMSMTTLNISSPRATFVRAVLPDQLVPIMENIGLNIIDANGVFVRRSQSLELLVKPTPIVININPLLLIGWGTESPYDQDLGGQDTAEWLKIMRSNPIFGQERFYRGAFIADGTDFIDPPGGNNDNIVDSADLTFYVGHGNSTCFTFTSLAKGPAQPASALFDFQATRSWGNRVQEWLCLLSCDVLDDNYQPFQTPDFRWGPDFDGLHLMLGFSTEALAGATTGPFGWGDSFEKRFVNDMAATVNPKWPMTIQQSWFDAAKSANVGNPAVLAPIGPGGVCDLNDYWWGVGSVGPRIRASQIKGWYYKTESN